MPTNPPPRPVHWQRRRCCHRRRRCRRCHRRRRRRCCRHRRGRRRRCRFRPAAHHQCPPPASTRRHTRSRPHSSAARHSQRGSGPACRVRAARVGTATPPAVPPARWPPRPGVRQALAGSLLGGSRGGGGGGEGGGGRHRLLLLPGGGRAGRVVPRWRPCRSCRPAYGAARGAPPRDSGLTKRTGSGCDLYRSHPRWRPVGACDVVGGWEWAAAVGEEAVRRSPFHPRGRTANGGEPHCRRRRGETRLP